MLTILIQYSSMQPRQSRKEAMKWPVQSPIFLAFCMTSASILFLGSVFHVSSLDLGFTLESAAFIGPKPVNLPYCDLNSLADANALENAIWVDPLDGQSLSPTLLSHPTSIDMEKQLDEEIWKDEADSERLKMISRLQLDTQSHCRLKEWDRDDFEQCLSNRRLIFVGDSMIMQQAESLSYLLDLTGNWTKVDRSERQKGICRHCIDAITKTGLHVVGRAVFHSDEEDGTPLRFNKEAWEMMVDNDLGGWKDGDILVVNYGAHYMADLLSLRSDLEILFHEVLAEIDDRVTIFWRDYAPAHFQSFSDGEYPPSHFVKYSNEPACVPHLTAPKTPSIVKHTVKKIMKACGENCKKIRTINVWDLLRNAWRQHKEGSHCFEDEWCDCRHYAIPGPMDYANILLYNQLCQ